MRSDEQGSAQPDGGLDDSFTAPGVQARPGGLLTIPIATALILDDGTILHWSRDAQSLLGYSPQEAMGRRAADLLTTPQNRDMVLELFAGILSGRDWSGVFPVRHRDGHLVNLEFRTHPLKGPNGHPLVLAVASDVRSLRQLESDLAVLDSFFTQAPVGMAVYDPDLRFVRLNDALAATNGLSVEEHLGRRVTEVLPGLNGEEIEAVMRSVLISGEPVVDARSHGLTPSDPDNEHAWSASYFRLEEPSGRVLGVSSTIVDVTARFHAEKRAVRARERLEVLSDASARIGTTLELVRTARELVDAMVPRVADVAAVFVLDHLVATGKAEEPVEPEGGTTRARPGALGSVGETPRSVRRLAVAGLQPEPGRSDTGSGDRAAHAPGGVGAAGSGSGSGGERNGAGAPAGTGPAGSERSDPAARPPGPGTGAGPGRKEARRGEVLAVPARSGYAVAMATGRTVTLPAGGQANEQADALLTGLLGAAPGTGESGTGGTGPVRITPLVARGTVLGMVVYLRRGDREAFEQEDVTLGDELASRAAIAIDNARLYLREHQTLLARQLALKEANAARTRLALVNEASARIGTTLDLQRTAQELAEVASPGLADSVVVEVLEDIAHGGNGSIEPRGPADRSALLRRLGYHSGAGEGINPIAQVGTVHRFHPATPYAWCLAHRRPVLVPEMDEQALRWFDADPLRARAVREDGLRSFMVVPLIARGAALGVACFYRTVNNRPFDQEDLALAGELASRAAVAIDNARLFTRERAASTAREQALVEAQAAQARLALLNDASSQIGTTLDLQRTAEELVELVVPRFADFVTVDLLDSVVQDGFIEEDQPLMPPDGRVLLRAVAVGEVQGNLLGSAADQVGQVSRSAAIYAESLRTGRSILFAHVDVETMHRITSHENRVEPALSAGVHSYLMVPLLARGQVLGGAEFIRMGHNPTPFDDDDVALAEELAARAAVAIDNARLYRRERSTALMLQHSLLPQEIRTTPGLDIAYRYLPASVISEVGGDWFDVIPLSCGRVALVVGDVMGHGMRAAASMGQLRTAARTLIGMDLAPDRVLRRLDETAAAMGEGQFATCVCAVFDPLDGRVVVASAGHLPPVLVEPDGTAVLLTLPTGAPLGVGGVPFEATEFTLPGEALLCLYTDGLVERRGRDLDVGLELLRDTVAEERDSLEQRCDAVLEALAAGNSEDDIAVILARVLPRRLDWIAVLDLSDDPEVVGEARRFVRATLAAWQLTGLTDVAQLLVSELVSNALLHAGHPTQLRLIRDRVLSIAVADTDARVPRVRHADADDEGGRGMLLINELAYRWGSRATAGGKLVWLELELPIGPMANALAEGAP
ncbi:SpoIIE family protein phosphatase [Streptacidiphilus jiangxiensis]|uniref:protein-serine/threonine phosphatase n=1 Tax=Streptacidiphilus jiangxiensis TaxID=235985 RepID=A0A1H7YEV9_STRJI|nr:SpoIIE family protein phosphatase [Streptacidiphilus jiangxiensis]SEM44766.1 PAS domain S-box-containing protein [Streptacidiphilus jiangxiensis]